MSILVNTGFKVGGAEPLNEYSVRETLDDRDDLVTNGYVYEGMEVYCKDTKIKYRWNGAAWDILDNAPTDESTHKTTIYENNIDMGKYLLLAKITGANYSNNIIKFSCPNYKGTNDTGFKYEDDMDIYKFELHFNTGSRRENNGYGVTLKQHGLGLYSYPLDNPQNTEPRIEEAIRLYWDYSKGDIYVFLVDIMTAIPHCVLEYTGSGTLLKENTFVMDDLYNRREGLNGTWEESRWKSIPYNKLETPPIHELGGDGGSTEGIKTYTTLDELGLTADATIDDVIGALKDGETALISTDEFTNYKDGMFPNQCANDQYAVIKVEKERGNRVFIEWRQKEGGAYAIGGLNNINKFTNWNNLVRFKKDGFADDSIIAIGDAVSADGVIQTLENLGFSNDILTWDTGVYRVSHVSGLINLPSDIKYEKPGFRLEHHDCKKWGVNHNPNTATWALRHSFLYAEDGNIYHRYYESGAEAGVYKNDTGWRKIQTGINYSTTEQAVGTWIDGSTVYRKVFIVDSVAAQTTEADVEICNLGFNTQKRIIKLSGTVNSIGNEGVLPYAYYPNGFQFFSYLQNDSVYFKGTWKYPLNSVRIIVEYIK